MPFNQVYSFTNDGKVWKIFADFDTLAIQTINEPPPDEIGPTVDAGILGLNEGDLITSSCGIHPGIDNTTLYRVVASFNYPYASFVIVRNSPDCGYVPPVTCVIPNTITTVNAVNGANNGSMTVSATPPSIFVHYRYSLDNGATWQMSPNFTGLFPGIYTLTIQSYITISYGGGCNVYVSFEILNVVVPVPLPAIDLPYKDTRNICAFFRLIIDGDIIEIAEPIGWDGVEITGSRDAEFHGWTFEFSDGEFPLKFDCAAGGDLIRAVYDSNGNDGDIGFQYGFKYFDAEFILLDAEVMLGTYRKFGDRVECVIHSTQLDQILLSRIETPVSMKETEGYDGAVIVPPDPYSMELHAKEILTQLDVDNPGRSYSDMIEVQGTTFWILFGVESPTKNDIQETNTYTLLSTQANPIPDQWNIKFSVAGLTDLNFAANITAHIRVDNDNLFSGKDGTISVQYAYRKKNADGSFTETFETISNIVNMHVGAFTHEYFIPNLIAAKNLAGVNFGEGDEIYFNVFMEWNADVDVQYINVVQNSLTFNVKHFERSAASVANVWFLDDAMRHIINVITNGKYAFRSSLLERANFQQLADGQASHRTVTNGFQIRKFDVDDRPLKLDLKKILGAEKAQNCIGVDYATDANGDARMRVERVDFFYQDKQILFIEDDIESYDEQVATELIVNEIEIGYETFLSEGFNSIDEFNTLHKYLTPIKKNPKKMQQKADVITSGYSIEDTRRQQFAETPTDSYDNDDATFMMAVRQNGSTWVPEKNEAFSTVTNVISPETSYNLRLDVKRMVYNWFIWLKGFLAYKPTTEFIKNTDFKQNGDLTTQFNAGEQNVIGDINKDLITEKENISLASMVDTPDIYRPEWVNVVCRLSPDKVLLINQAMTGLSDITKNYGYILVRKPDDGLLQAGFIYSMKYNYAKEKLSFKMLKKFSSPTEPIVDCCPWLAVNGCYLKVNGNKIIP